jgi:23S rRNA (guanosine2251-2'-O)-methyltransferase
MRDNSRDDRKPGKFKPRSGPKRPFKGNPDKRDRDDKGGKDKSWGDKPRGDKPRGDKAWGQKKSWDEKPRRNDDRKEGRKDFRDNKFKDKKFGDKKFGDKKFGDRKFGDKKFDKRPEKRFGNFDEAPKREHSPRPNLYGFHAVREAWLNPARKIKTLFLTEAAEAEFAVVLKKAYEDGLERPGATAIDKQKLDYMLPRGAVHQGIALITDALDEVSIQDFIIKSKSQDKTVLLILDQVTDPHNVGAILRSACAFGADGIIMQRKHAPELEGVLAKTASGAVEHIPVAYETNLSRSIEDLKEEGFFVFGLDERGEREVGDILRNNDDKNHKLALVLGAEGPGMRRLVKENCDELVKLPTRGEISSLNVSNAAAVALYALLK